MLGAIYMLMLISMFYLPRCSVLPGVGASQTWPANIVGILANTQSSHYARKQQRRHVSARDGRRYHQRHVYTMIWIQNIKKNI